MLNKISSLSLTIPLGWLFSHLFMWSNNAHMFSTKALLTSLGFIIFVACMLWAMGALCIKLSHKMFSKHQKILNIIQNILFATVFSAIVGFFLFIPMLAPNPALLPSIVLFFSICAILFFIKAKFLNTILLVLIVFSSVNTISGLIFSNASQEASTNKQAIAKLSEVKLKQKPNIYLFWLESYHAFSIQEEIYGIDTKPIQKFLADNEFVTFPEVYSDGRGTLSAYAELYGMGKYNIQEVGNVDVNTTTRELIGGSEDNILFKILKNNGYFTGQLLYPMPLYFMTFNKKSPYLDRTDFDHLYDSYLTLLAPCYYFVPSLRNKAIRSQRIRSYLKTKDNINTTIQQLVQGPKPFFLSFKDGANHTPGSGYSFKDAQSWIQGGTYQKYVKNGNESIKSIVQNILNLDPNAMIVIVADHGATRFRGVTDFSKSIEEIQKDLKAANVSYEDFIDDKFGCMMAIRFPNGEQIDITAGKYMSQRNLFTHIFAYLSDDPSLLEYRAVSRSQLLKNVLTQDGKIVHK